MRGLTAGTGSSAPDTTDAFDLMRTSAKTQAASPKQPPQSQRLAGKAVAFAGVCSLLAVAALAGRTDSVPPGGATQAVAEAERGAEIAPSAMATPPAAKRAARRPETTAVRSGAADAPKPWREANEGDRRVREALGLIDTALQQRALLDPLAGPEATANHLNEYLRGWTDALIRLTPELSISLGTQIEERFCSKAAAPSELIVMSRLIRAMPELATERGFDCVFARHPEESIVLWSMLDAWQEAGLPKTPALEAIEKSATDPRTQRRFLTRSDQERLRSSVSAATAE